MVSTVKRAVHLRWCTLVPNFLSAGMTFSSDSESNWTECVNGRYATKCLLHVGTSFVWNPAGNPHPWHPDARTRASSAQPAGFRKVLLPGVLHSWNPEGAGIRAAGLWIPERTGGKSSTSERDMRRKASSSETCDLAEIASKLVNIYSCYSVFQNIRVLEEPVRNLRHDIVMESRAHRGPHGHQAPL